MQKQQAILAVFLAAVAVLAAGGSSSSDVPRDIAGTWELRGDEASAHVTIVLEDGTLTGRLSWLEIPEYPPDDPRGMPGRPRVDRNNPDPSLQDRPLDGLLILSDFTYEGDGRWKDGRIYAPDEGKTYRCRLRLTDEETLEVRAYKKILFAKPGRTMRWHRVAPEALELVDRSASENGDQP